MDSVKLSIIIPVYNNYKSLKKCLQSISQQSFKNPVKSDKSDNGASLEVIVVDDGSFSSLVEASRRDILKTSLGEDASGSQKTRVQFFQMEHGGAPKARNFGFNKSTGEYLFFCDADVIFLKPDALQKMIEILDKHPDKVFAYSLFKYGWKKFYRGPFNVEKLKQNNYISGNSIIRRSVLEKISINGPWDESLKRFQDWDLWLTIVEQGGEGIFIPEVLWQAEAGGTISKWLPKFLYKFKFLKSVKEFERAKKIVKEKHGLI